MSEKTSPCITGDQITSETILRAHFSAGGIVQIAGVEKWYRMPTTQLFVLCPTDDEWAESWRDLGELVRNEQLIACAEPEVSKRMREDDSGASDYKLAQEADERERQRKEDNDQVRRDVGAPKITLGKNPCRCSGCARMKDRTSLISTTFSPRSMLVTMYAHGSVYAYDLTPNEAEGLRDEITRWLERAE